MAEEKKNLEVEETEGKQTKVKATEKKPKPVEKSPNFFARMFKRIKKFFSDVCGEMRKVAWTSKEELSKSTKLVLVTVIAVGLAIAVVDTCFSWIINSIAGIFG